MFCTTTVVLMTSSSLSPLLHHCVAESSFSSACCITCSPDPSRLEPQQCWLFDTRLFALISLFGISLQLALLLFLPAVGTALFFMGPRVPSPAVFLSFTSVRSVFFRSHLPSPVAIGLLFRAPRTRCILLLLHLSWLTDSLSPFLSS